jgi:hypothetical protein
MPPKIAAAAGFQPVFNVSPITGVLSIVMHRRILLTIALLLLPAATQAAGDAPLDRATLRGLKGVGVVIDVLDSELQKLGVTRDALTARLAARLQAGRITIDPSATEFLALRITAVRQGRGTLALALSFGLYQPVLLSRNHDIRTSTQTWEVDTVLMADPKVVLTACAETADDLADRFAAAFHSTNPE